MANSKEYQLYNLSEDISQQNNLAKSNAAKLQEMIAAYEAIGGPKKASWPKIGYARRVLLF